MATTTTSRTFLCIVCALYAVALIADVKATEAIANSTSDNTDKATDDSSAQWKPEKALSRSERAGVVTLEFIAAPSSETLANISQRLPVIVAQVLNRVKSAAVPEKDNETYVEEGPTNSTSLLFQRLRRRSTAADQAPDRYSDDGVGLVKVDPVEKNGRLRVAIVAVDRDGTILAAAQLRDRLEENKNDISSFVGYEVHSIYAGLPATDIAKRPTVWDNHRNLFYGILILILVALVILAVCCLCFHCCRRRRACATSACGQKKELKQPLADEEMVELTPVVPLQSAPQQQANHRPEDSEQPAADDDENGWIVPLDQLSNEELEQPADAQISKL